MPELDLIDTEEHVVPFDYLSICKPVCVRLERTNEIGRFNFLRKIRRLNQETPMVPDHRVKRVNGIHNLNFKLILNI